MNIILLNFEIEKKIYKDNCAKAHWLFESTKNNNDKLIDLDVGGTEKIITTLKTLTKFPKSALGECFQENFISKQLIKGFLLIEMLQPLFTFYNTLEMGLYQIRKNDILRRT